MNMIRRLFKHFFKPVAGAAEKKVKTPSITAGQEPVAFRLTPEEVNEYLKSAAAKAEDEVTQVTLSSLTCVAVKTVRKAVGSETVFTLETVAPFDNIEELQTQLSYGLALKYGKEINPRVILTAHRQKSPSPAAASGGEKQKTPIVTTAGSKPSMSKPSLAYEDAETTEKSGKASSEGAQSKFTKTKPENIKKIIAVASGKGGVGKSAIALGLARALVKKGFQTGLLDADIYGPSVENMSGAHERVKLTDNKLIPTVARHDIQIASVGFTTDPGSPVVLRGPMMSALIKQLITKTEWGALDYLVIDTPPGAGDAYLTLFRDLEIAGVVVVSTAQKAAISDTKRCISFIKRLETPIIGAVENMSGFECSDCGKAHFIFGKGKVKALAEEEEIAYLGALPMSSALSEAAERGVPASDCGDEEAEAFFNALVETVHSTPPAGNASEQAQSVSEVA